jgi:hypothetical protein
MKLKRARKLQVAKALGLTAASQADEPFRVVGCWHVSAWSDV